MGKRSSFERVPRDFYPTPREAVLPLLDALGASLAYDEPCCGDGALIRHLKEFGHECSRASDIAPDMDGAEIADALSLTECKGDVFITNPPWDRKILHPLITHLSDIADTFLLFDADWMHTKQAIPLMPRLRQIISVGRVKWIPDSKMTGKDNVCWYRFEKEGKYWGPTPEFWPRRA